MKAVWLKALILILSLSAAQAYAGPSEDAESRIADQLGAVASTDAAAFVQLMKQEADAWAALPAGDTAGTAARNVRTNIMLGIAMGIKEDRLPKKKRIAAVMGILAKAYRQKSFRGMEMVIDDIKSNRALYDREIASITDLQVRKLINEDINAYMQPQAD